MATKKTKPSIAKKTTSPKIAVTKATKAPVKESPKSVVHKEISPVASKTSTIKIPKFKVRKLYIILAVIVIALIGLMVYYRQLFVVAIVNGQPITRLSYMQEVEGVYLQDQRVTAGKQALNQLVTKTLLYQEAQKRHITVTDKEVNDEVSNTRKMLEKQKQKLEEALTLQGDSLPAYEDRIRTQKLIQKLVGKITVTDKEIDEYIKQNEANLQGLTGDDLKNQVKQTLESQKSNEKLQALIQSLQQKAKVTYLISK